MDEPVRTDPKEIAARLAATHELARLELLIYDLSDQMKPIQDKVVRDSLRRMLAEAAAQHKAIREACKQKGWL